MSLKAVSLGFKRKKKHNDQGASLVEYGLLAGLISVGSIGAVLSTGTTVEDIYCKASSSIAYALRGVPSDCLTDEQLAWMFGPLEGQGGSAGEDAANGGGSEETAASFNREFGSDSWDDEAVMIPIPAGGFSGSGPHSVRATPVNGGAAGACSGVSGNALCTDVSSGVTQQVIADGDTEFGYTVDLPDDPRTSFSQTVLVEVIDGNGNVVFSEEATATKPAAEQVYASIEQELGHWEIPAGTTGEYFIWAPVNDFNAPFLIALDEGTTGGVSQPCVRSIEGEATCKSSGVILTPGDHNALGFRIGEVPLDTRVDADYWAFIAMDSTLDPAVSYDLSATASREPEPVVLSVTGTMFKDEIIPMGTTGDFTVKEPLVGSFNGDMLFDINPAAGVGFSYVHLCTWGPLPAEIETCRNFASGPIQVSKDASAIGYKVVDLNSSVDEEVHLTISDFSIWSILKPDMRHDWEGVYLERPLFEPQVAALNSCHEHYLAGERLNAYYPINMGGAETRLFCQFETSGALEGGWTLVTFQNDQNPIDWNQGIASGFHARSNTKSLTSYSLSAGQVPSHSSVAFGSHDGSSAYFIDAFDMAWAPGAQFNHTSLPMENPGAVSPTGPLTGLISGKDAALIKFDNQMAGNWSGFRSPFSYTEDYHGTVSVAYGTNAPAWAFWPGVANTKQRGYAFGGWVTSRNEAFGYSIFVR
jgi:Flp pilus assembly pilin Flp